MSSARRSSDDAPGTKRRLDGEYLGGLALMSAVAGVVTGAFAGRRTGALVGAGVAAAGLGLSWFRMHLERSRRVHVVVGPTRSAPRGRSLKHIICLDGTWNTPDVPTNVRRLYELVHLADPEQRQIGHYYPGVGTRELTGASSAVIRAWFSRTLTGGASGCGRYGVLSTLRRAYFDFVNAYQPGDEVFIFGFSRGAATARALANYIGKTYGLPARVTMTCLTSGLHADVPIGLAVEPTPERDTPEIAFLGLWDTVASTGNPLNRRELRELDLTVPAAVRHVCHLVAAHERRRGYRVTLIEPDDRVDEVWFPGRHSDVGGGMPDGRLADLSLRYMLGRAGERGLVFRPGPAERAFDRQHAPASMLPKPSWARARSMTPLGPPGARPRIHKSVFTLRDADAACDPGNIPPADGYIVEGRD